MTRLELRRLNLFTIVVLIPVLAAVAFAVHKFRVTARRQEAMAMFNRALESGDLLPCHRLVKDYGIVEAREHFARAAESDLIAFDGRLRLAQINQNGLRYPQGSLDVLCLHDFSDPASTAFYQPPIGTMIDSVVFAGDGVDIALHGDLILDKSTIKIPAGKPEVYHLSWPPGSPLTSRPLSWRIENRQR